MSPCQTESDEHRPDLQTAVEPNAPLCVGTGAFTVVMVTGVSLHHGPDRTEVGPVRQPPTFAPGSATFVTLKGVFQTFSFCLLRFSSVSG